MLTDLRLRDYKSYRGENRIPLRRLSLLLGKNNSGKTAAARVPLLLFGALGQRVGSRREPLPRSVRGMGYGSSLLELVHGESAHASFGIGCDMADAGVGGPLTLAIDIQLRQQLSTGLTAFVSRFAADPWIPTIQWTGDVNRSDVDYGEESLVGFTGLIPEFRDDPRGAAAERLRGASADFLDRLVHLTSLRRPLNSIYEYRTRDSEWDPEGSDVPYLLNESTMLLESVANWYAECLGTRVQLASDAYAFRLVSPGRSGADHSLARSGQGIQQVLPVVTHLRAMALGIGPQLLVVEEPELNLHPAAHPFLGDLAVEAISADRHAQILVETHSENLVLRVRNHVANGRIRPDDVNILWFEQRKGGTKVREILIRRDGSVSDWPTGVFSEDLEEARAIAKAGRT